PGNLPPELAQAIMAGIPDPLAMSMPPGTVPAPSGAPMLPPGPVPTAPPIPPVGPDGLPPFPDVV
ncbi:MAG: hypothetical protein LBQ12_14140, partial [Deltaproteobacteria bacterium]|nr:hypothetical protein [Deltaproteobacteria bacterium]